MSSGRRRQASTAVRAGAVAAFGVEREGAERLVVVCEAEPRSTADPAALAAAVRQAVSEEHEVAVHEVVVVESGAVPRTSSGKVRRGACRCAYEDGELPVLARTGDELAAGAGAAPSEDATRWSDREALRDAADPQPHLLDWLRLRVARISGLAGAAIDPESPLAGLGIDSLNAVELATGIEEELGIAVAYSELAGGTGLAHLSAILAQRLRAGSPPAGPAPAAAAGDVATPGQRALWFLQRLAPASSAYHLAAAFAIEDGPDAAVLERAWQGLVERHAALRSRFPAVDGEPVARRHEPGEAGALDVRRLALPAGSPAELRRELAHEVGRPFDLEAGPLARFVAWDQDGNRGFLVVLHHLVADFASMAILARDLSALLTVESGAPLAAPGPPPEARSTPAPNWRDGEEGRRLLAAWADRLAGRPAVLELPTDRPRPPVVGHRAGARPFTLSAGELAAARAFAASRGTTPFTVLLATFQTVLHRWTGQTVVPIGTPTAGRGAAELAGSVGYFVNPVVIASEIASAAGFASVVDRVHQEVLFALDHRRLPFPVLAEALDRRREGGRNPLFQVMFLLHGGRDEAERALAAVACGGEGVAIALGGRTARSIGLPPAGAQFDLTLVAAAGEDELVARFEYAADLAYVIYTSGSTGRPKGVAIEHRSAAALIAWAASELSAEELSGVAAVTSVCFDLSIFEIFLPLAVGGAVVLFDDALGVADHRGEPPITLLNTVPSAAAELARLGGIPETVRTIDLAGEPLRRDLVERLYALPHVARVLDLYGPSEDTTYSTWSEVERGAERPVTIGRPIGGTRACWSTGACGRWGSACPASSAWPAPASPAATSAARR
jgi:acyl carrier protein